MTDTMQPRALYVDEQGVHYACMGYDVNGAPVRYRLTNQPVVEAPPVLAQPDPVGDIIAKIAPSPLTKQHWMTWRHWKDGILKREPVTTKWWESIWFWCWMWVTAFLACWWWYEMFMVTENHIIYSIHGVYQGWEAVALAAFGWLWWGWMPIGIGAIGALQKAGYKRLAVVLSVTMTALMAAFFARDDK